MPFQNFPYTNFQNLNLDWILRNIKNAVEQATLARTSASEAVEAVDYATNLANEAQRTADTANDNANNAVQTANSAYEAVGEALEQVEYATTVADEAEATANTAGTNASNAVQTANTANSTANNALLTAQQALDTVATKNTKIFMTGMGSSFADTQGTTLTRAQILSKLTAGDNLYFVKTDTKEIYNLFAADTNFFSIYHIQHDANNATTLSIITIPESGTVNVYSYPFPSGGGGGGDGIYLINAHYVAQNQGFSFDKTTAQIVTAINAGLLPVVRRLDDELSDNILAELFVLGNYSYDGEDSYFSFYRATGTQIEEMHKTGSESYAYKRTFNYLPASAAADSGKFLRVNAQGMPAWVPVPAAENASFGGV